MYINTFIKRIQNRIINNNKLQDLLNIKSNVYSYYLYSISMNITINMTFVKLINIS